MRTWVVCSKRARRPGQSLERRGLVERASGDRERRVGVVQVTAQALLDAGALGHEVLAVV